MSHHLARQFLILALLVTGCQPHGNEPLSTTDLVRRAQTEGSTVLTYGMPDNYGGYRGLFEAFEDRYGIRRLDIDMSSSAALSRLRQETDEPQVDLAVVGYLYGPAAEEAGVLDCVPCDATSDLPAWASGPPDQGCRGWFATFTGTLGFMVNREVIVDPPRTWDDLLRDDLRGRVGYIDPRTSATGVGTILAASLAKGGSAERPEAGIELLVQLAADGGMTNVLPRQDYDAFVRGTLPVLINYDYNLAQLQDSFGIVANFYIPQDGTVQIPYSTLLVRDRPHTYTGRLLLEFMLGHDGQALLSQGHVTPIRTAAAASGDPRVRDVDWLTVAASVESMKAAFDQRIGQLGASTP